MWVYTVKGQLNVNFGFKISICRPVDYESPYVIL